MNRTKIAAVLVTLGLSVPGAIAASPATAATPAAACAKQSKAVAAAKKKLKKAKSTKAKKAAKRSVATAQKRLKTCKAKKAAPAAPAPPAAPVAPAPAPVAPAPAPTTNLITVDPATPGTSSPITVTFRAPSPAPVVGQQFRIQVLVPGGNREVCAGIATTDRPADPAGVSYTFQPWGVPPSQIGTPNPTTLSTWCAGPATVTVYVRDSGQPYTTMGSSFSRRC